MNDIGDSLLRGAQQALDYARGQQQGAKTYTVAVPKQINVRAIRDNLHLSRTEFSQRFGFSLRTVEKWEQGIRQPEGPARAYLTVIAHNPKAVITALSRHHDR